MHLNLNHQLVISLLEMLLNCHQQCRATQPKLVFFYQCLLNKELPVPSHWIFVQFLRIVNVQKMIEKCKFLFGKSRTPRRCLWPRLKQMVNSGGYNWYFRIIFYKEFRRVFKYYISPWGGGGARRAFWWCLVLMQGKKSINF